MVRQAHHGEQKCHPELVEGLPPHRYLAFFEQPGKQDGSDVLRRKEDVPIPL
jgi:hypothetical protein